MVNIHPPYKAPKGRKVAFTVSLGEQRAAGIADSMLDAIAKRCAYALIKTEHGHVFLC
jgi:hypothetical protein